MSLVNFKDKENMELTSEKDSRSGAFVQLPIEILRNENLSSTALKLYLILLSYANQKQVAWPGQTLLAHDMNLSERQVRTLLDDLGREGLIIIERIQGFNNTYILVGQKLLKTPDTTPRKETSTSSEKIITGVEGKETSPELHEVNYPVCETPSVKYEEEEPLSSEPVTTQALELNSNLPDSKPFKSGETHELQNPFETMLTQNLKVSRCHACELAGIAQRNGRDLSYLERLISLSREGTIYNPVGFVRFMIMRDAEPSTLKAHQTGKARSAPKTTTCASSSSSIDFIKYTTGKYAYLTARSVTTQPDSADIVSTVG